MGIEFILLFPSLRERCLVLVTRFLETDVSYVQSCFLLVYGGWRQVQYLWLHQSPEQKSALGRCQPAFLPADVSQFLPCSI